VCLGNYRLPTPDGRIVPHNQTVVGYKIEQRNGKDVLLWKERPTSKGMEELKERYWTGDCDEILYLEEGGSKNRSRQDISLFSNHNVTEGRAYYAVKGECLPRPWVVRRKTLAPNASRSGSRTFTYVFVKGNDIWGALERPDTDVVLIGGSDEGCIQHNPERAGTAHQGSQEQFDSCPSPAA